VNERRFLNQAQPQTLIIATLLLYVNAFFDLITFFPILMLFGIGLAAGGYGIANERKWGYGLAVGIAIVRVALLLAWYGLDVLDFPIVLTLMFDGALVALLVHPESRDYQRIWFK
jgi:hypothetical protein